MLKLGLEACSFPFHLLQLYYIKLSDYGSFIPLHVEFLLLTSSDSSLKYLDMSHLLQQLSIAFTNYKRFLEIHGSFNLIL